MRWLLDEMLPPALAEQLGQLGHDAVTARSAGLAGQADQDVYERAVDDDRVIVTENFGDFARLAEDRLATGKACISVVFVRKPVGGGLGDLASRLDRWALANPEPYPGIHWPRRARLTFPPCTSS